MSRRVSCRQKRLRMPWDPHVAEICLDSTCRRRRSQNEQPSARRNACVRRASERERCGEGRTELVERTRGRRLRSKQLAGNFIGPVHIMKVRCLGPPSRQIELVCTCQGWMQSNRAAISRDSSAHDVQSAGDPHYVCTGPSVCNSKGAVGVTTGERIMFVWIRDFKVGQA